MFYGGTGLPQTRRASRHYSQDGSMEITNDKSKSTTSFVFYLGGDAYTAPAIWRDLQTSTSASASIFYLHRDYQSTILQITNATGQIQENRLFDAWGNILKITNGAGATLTAFIITDRGYTGHEHLLSVGLINMNARLGVYPDFSSGTLSSTASSRPIIMCKTLPTPKTLTGMGM